MSLDQIFAILLSIYAVALTAVISLQIIGASIFDVRQAKKRRQRQLHPYLKAFRQRPQVTAIIIVQNQAQSIQDCLNSLRRSTYRKLHVLVIDNSSEDESKTIIREYMQRYPKFSARLVAKRLPASWAKAVHDAWKRYGKGELIILSGGDNNFEKSAIKNFVGQYQQIPHVDILVPQMQTAQINSLNALLHTYMTMLSQRARKTASLLQRPSRTGSIAFNSRVLPAVIKANQSSKSIQAINVTKAVNYHFVPEAVIKNRSQRAPKALRLAWPRTLKQLLMVSLDAGQALVVILTPILITYFIYLAVSLREPTFLLLTMGGLGLLLTFAVWEDEQLGLRQRLAFTAGIPITYTLFYLQSWRKLIPF